MPILLLLFIVMPIAEIAVLIQVGSSIGLWTTILVVILTAVIGTFMLRQQGLATLNKAQLRMQGGEMPAQQMLEGVLLLIGGVLLLTPGFITDFFGFCTLFPVTRQFLAKQLAARSVGNMNVFVGGTTVNPQPGVNTEHPSARSQGPAGPKGSGDKGSNVIDGDYRRVD